MIGRFGLLLVLSSIFSPVYNYPQPNSTQAIEKRRITLIGPIRKCPTNSDLLLECTRKVIADLTPLISSKIKEFGLHPLDPVSIDKFVYSLTFGPVNILVQNKNAVITGVSNYDSFSVGIDPKNMKAKFVYEVPYLQLETEYKLSGNAFFFPLTGAGPAHLELFNVKCEGDIIGRLDVNSVGEQVVQTEKVNFQHMKIGDMNMSIRGLFDGNSVLSSVIHYFWKRFDQEVFEIVRPELEKFTSDFISNEVLNPILVKLPNVVEYIPRID